MQERRPVTALTDDAPVAADHPGRSSGVRRLVVALSVTGAVVLADQLTKWWAVTRLANGPVHLIGTLDFELSRNTGSAFSLLQGKGFLLIAVATLAAVGLVAMMRRASSAGQAAALGLILGGARGNLSDRLFRGDHGAVVDFVALHFWPTFNVADASIVVGCGLLLVSLVRGPEQP
jgi:signal peptidase II